LLLPEEIRNYFEGESMTIGTSYEHKEKNELEETTHTKRLQRIIAVLFFLALLSLGAFILLRLVLERTP
jgi:hypothetical protein